MAQEFDLFVIGGGSGGVRCARISAQHGAKVGIAEGRFWGGTCVNVGCVPKKIMVSAAEYGLWAEDSAAFGWEMTKQGHDWSKLAAARDAEVARLNGIYGRLLEGAGVTRFEGYAKFVDAHTVEVGGETIKAKNILIATGGNAVRPEIPGAELGYISDDLFTLKEMPKRVVVVGSGFIALEYASLLKGLGAEVTLMYRQALPLRGFDQDIRQAMADALQEQFIGIHASESPLSLEKTSTGLLLKGDNGSHLAADAVFFATGRKPATAGLNLEAAGVKLGARGEVLVDDNHATSQKHIYALGDVVDRVNLTPMATATGHALADTLFGHKPRKASYENVPSAVFTSPPVASIGLTEEEAAKRGPVNIYLTKFNTMRHTISKRVGRKTLMKLVVDAETDKVLGAHFMGEDAPEMMQGVAVAIIAGATKAHFDQTIGIHPTAAEEFVTLRTLTRRTEKTV
ncbi:glutathione-disulfide reductase [Acetobacteraceae bacterium H6797]|nr:glutathione-disulfide reductase [Acetobacteraceae bacterium H6797]